MPLPFLLPLAARLLPVRRFFAPIPWQAWLALGIALCVLLGALWHGKKVRQFGEERYTAGVKAERDRAEAAAKTQAAKDERIAGKIKEQNREEADRINRDADTLRLSGPGRARCPAPAKPANGREPQPRLPDVAGPEMPADDRAAVPWGWLVQRAEQCDLNRAEVLAWRDWHKQLSESRADR